MVLGIFLVRLIPILVKKSLNILHIFTLSDTTFVPSKNWPHHLFVLFFHTIFFINVQVLFILFLWYSNNCWKWTFSAISTHWGRVTHICVGNLAIIGSNNGLSPGRRQAIIWTDVGILLIGSWGTNFSEIWIGIETFSLKKIHLKMSSAKGRLFSLGLNELRIWLGW